MNQNRQEPLTQMELQMLRDRQRVLREIERVERKLDQLQMRLLRKEAGE